MADSDRVALRYVAESSWGTTPATPAMQEIRFTGESFRTDTDSTESNEIRSDRQVADIIRTAQRTSGDLNIELSYGAYDAFFKAALLTDADWTAKVEDADSTGISAAQADNSINGVTGTFVAGQWLRTKGFATAANNGVFKVVSSLGGKIVLSGGTLVNENAGAHVTVTQASSIVNGVTPVSFTFEREYADITKFALFTGLLPTGFGVDVKVGGIMTGSFNFVGKGETSGTATVAQSSADPAETPVMNSIDNVVNVVDNATAISAIGFSLKLVNGFRPKPQLKSLSPVGYGTGRMVVNGTLSVYFADSTLVDKYLNWTNSSLAVAFRDDSGNIYIFECPRVKYTAAPRPAAGKDQDIVVDLQWRAYKDPTEEITIRISKIAA